VRLLRCSNWFVRAAEMLKERHAELCSAAKARDERTTILEEAMVVLMVNWEVWWRKYDTEGSRTS
jgi:hypothetical protein